LLRGGSFRRANSFLIGLDLCSKRTQFCLLRAWSTQRVAQQFLNDGNPTGADDRAEIERFGALTPRERQVLAEIMAGASNKEAGRKLGISPRTIEVHRARIMEKLGARNTAHLVRIVLAQGTQPDPRH
jgi:DNA-binding CsgD family transcriptional regulator